MSTTMSKVQNTPLHMNIVLWTLC